MNGAEEVMSKKEEVRSAVEIRFTDFIELQGRTRTGCTFIEWRSDTDRFTLGVERIPKITG